MPILNDGTLRSKYHALKADRTPYENRAEENAAYTIPALFPPVGNKDSRLPSLYQSVGADGVNTLANKIHIALFPPGQPYFRYDVTAPEAEQDETLKADIQKALSKYEQRITEEQTSARFRSPTGEAVKHLIVVGNVLLYFGDKVEMYNLRQYVVRRAPNGTVLEIIIEEARDVREFSKDELVEYKLEDVAEKDNPEKVTQYTRVYLDAEAGRYRARQEINSFPVKGKEASWPMNKVPYLALRFYEEDGKDYSRAFVEDYQGDLRTLEGLSQAITEGSIAAARVLYGVDPSSQVKPDDLLKAPNGSALAMREGEAFLLQARNAMDLATAERMIDRLEKRLGAIFLDTQSVQRKGERVTAFEIRAMIQELEENLGGVYSTLTNELQTPAVYLTQARLARKGQLRELPKGIVNLRILTGLDALGRSRDLIKLNSFFRSVTIDGAIADTVMPYLKIPAWIQRVATAEGINVDDVIKTPEEMQAEQAQAMEAEVEQQAATAMANQVAKEE